MTSRVARHRAQPLRWQPLAIAIGAALTAVIAFAGAPVALRLPAAALLFSTGAGLGWTPILGLHRDRLLAAVTVVIVSLSADVIVAQAVMWVGGLRWEPCVLLLVLVTVAGAIVQMRRKDRSW